MYFCFMNFGFGFGFFMMVLVSILSLSFSSVITNNNNSSIREQVTQNNNDSTVTNDNSVITMANIDNITKVSRCSSENCNTYDITFDDCCHEISRSQFIRLQFNALMLALNSIANARSHFTGEELRIITKRNLGNCVTNMHSIIQGGHHILGICEGLTEERINQVAKGYFDACISEAKINNTGN